MSKVSSISKFLFRAVCIFSSVLLVMMTLISHARLMALEKTCAGLEEEIILAERKTEILEVRLENRLSLYDLESIATKYLGMQIPSTEQLFFDMIPG